jgi:hypothetical protein
MKVTPEYNDRMTTYEKEIELWICDISKTKPLNKQESDEKTKEKKGND